MKDNLVKETDLKRNNLDRSSSPYLLQHVSNPVWWQEWTVDTIRYAEISGKPILVSIGYATCHWCHVMASEAFSDSETASFLNQNFVCVKVDREQRPDIDQYMMDFINSQGSNGGWPLNVFLNSSLKPVYALTYAPSVRGRYGLTFLEISQKVFDFIQENKEKLSSFNPAVSTPEAVPSETLADTLLSIFDEDNGGFGLGQKFPSHSTLLFLLYNYSVNQDDTVKNMVTKTLDSIELRGLNDHLQGGIFRYSVDRKWTIPHFEKMLYDQAMTLWIYSLAYKITKNDDYRSMAIRVLKCLEDSFEKNGVFITAHDADTSHSEGATYLWDYQELRNLLGIKDFEEFCESYSISPEGNFEGLNHLIRSNTLALEEIEEKLLSVRKKRDQPAADDKILCGLNGLVAIALIHAGRFLEIEELNLKASVLVGNLIRLFWDGKSLAHSFRNGIIQKQSFLSDASALYVAVTFLYEDSESWKSLMADLERYVRSFHEGGKWFESRGEDFRAVYASGSDHPVPSSVAMADFGLTRAAILTSTDYPSLKYYQPYQSDFHNITAMMTNGLFHFFTSPEPLGWAALPANSIQVRGAVAQDCYMGSCRLIDNKV